MKPLQENGRRALFVAGCRIPFQRAGSGYKDLTSYDLARLALRGLLRRTSLAPASVDRVILGTVISNITTSNVAREAALAAGIPASAPAHTITQACISSNQAITTGVDLIATGQAEVVIAGGTESMSDLPIRYRKRFRQKLIESQRYKSVFDYFKLLRGLSASDLLPEIPSISEFSTGWTMGQDCERLAGRFGVTREEQDAYAVRSHRLAAQATQNGWFHGEIEPVRIPPDFETVHEDNGIRGDTSLEQMAKLKPAFVKPYGNITAGNASFLTDGAAMLLLMSPQAAAAAGFTPTVAIRDYVYTGQDPSHSLLLGPAHAIPPLLERNGLTLGEIDVFEFHEAFAGQVLANLKCLDSDSFAQEHLGRAGKTGELPLERLNTQGGSLSLGHPFGATGARLLTAAARRLVHEEGRLALCASCAAGGLGSAILLERF